MKMKGAVVRRPVAVVTGKTCSSGRLPVDFCGWQEIVYGGSGWGVVDQCDANSRVWLRRSDLKRIWYNFSYGPQILQI